MKHYFVVTFDYRDEIQVLVRAEDVIEAGQKVIDTYSEAGFNKELISINKVERIKIMDVID